MHPTTIGYGIVAQEVMTLMAEAGIDVGSAKPTVDFAALLEQDTLINSPPGTLSGALGVISWVDRLRDALAGLRGR